MTREINIICLFISRFCSYYFLFLSEVYNFCVPILWLVLALVRWVNIIPPLRFWNFQTWALSPRPLSKLHHAFAARVKKLFVQKKKHCWPHTVVTYSVYRQHYQCFLKFCNWIGNRNHLQNYLSTSMLGEIYLQIVLLNCDSRGFFVPHKKIWNVL